MLIIRSSQIHAAGCYTTEPIKKRSRIVEYTGPRITKQAADKKYQDSPTTYLFGVGDGSKVIDGHGMAMCIKALRDIAAGEELTYDYNLYDGDDDAALCNCGAPGCRKSMYSPDELKRRARAAKRSAAKRKKARESPATFLSSS